MPPHSTSGGLQWPLNPDEFYIPAIPARPIMQGDIFADIPFTKAKRGNTPADPPNMLNKRRLVAVTGYPCDMYTDDGRLATVQTIAPVINASHVGIPEHWDGAYTFAPLPDLHGDGAMHAVDLRAAANIDAFYLTTESRIRCLSELGWAAFRQRLGLASTRLLNHLSDLTTVGTGLWTEMDLWTQWNQSGRSPHAFQAWLNEREANLSGFTRREALHRGMHDLIRATLHSQLRDD